MRRNSISFSTITIIIIVVCVLFFLGVKVFRIEGDEQKYMKYVSDFSLAIEKFAAKNYDNGEHTITFDYLKSELISNKYIEEFSDPGVLLSGEDIILTKTTKQIAYYNYQNTTTFENRFEISFIKDGKTFVCTRTECR